MAINRINNVSGHTMQNLLEHVHFQGCYGGIDEIFPTIVLGCFYTLKLDTSDVDVIISTPDNASENVH
jgi:hypothetical protein